MKITPVGAGLVHAAGQSDREKQRYDEVKSCVSKFCEGA